MNRKINTNEGNEKKEKNVITYKIKKKYYLKNCEKKNIEQKNQENGKKNTIKRYKYKAMRKKFKLNILN